MSDPVVPAMPQDLQGYFPIWLPLSLLFYT
ncbi:MAG: hypothetical protein ACI8R9_002313 [Paraglaciecola sp.]|jgi:hypothetical protein